MKLRVETAELHLRETFTISRESHDTVTTVLASLERDGVTGWGEASPSRFYGHTAESVAAGLERAAPLVAAADPYTWRHTLEGLLERVDGNRAALCAVDLAWHDWIAQRFGVPFHRLLGLDPARAPRSSYTIGISSIEHMRAKVRAAAGFSVLKIKVGTEDDIDRIRALRGETSAVFRVDANCAWDADTAIRMSRELAALGVEFIEQPLPPEQLDDMERVYRESALPVFADENAVEPGDVGGLAGRFHGVNIKLVKCGGLQPALRMVETARSLGLEVMLGCMIESSVGISAAAQIAPLVDHIDLDGALLIDNDPFEGVENRLGVMRFPQRPGLGAVRRPAPGR